MIKNYLSLILIFFTFIFSYGQTNLAKEDIAIIGVNTDSEDFTFLLRTDISIGTEIYFSDNEVALSGTALLDTNEGIVLFTAANDYSCGTVIGYLNNSTEFSNVSGSLALNNGGDELLAFQGYDNSDDSWTTFLHANVDAAITLPVGFTALDIVDGTSDNREYNGNTNNPDWLDLNDITNYNEGNDFSTISLSTNNFTCTAPCTPTHTITSFIPLSGPVGTLVTINGSGFTPTSIVEINGTNATIISQSTNELVVEVLSGTTTGPITITEAGCPLSSTLDFNIIENTGTCSSSLISDIIISEVYDSDIGNNWYLELFNPTNADIDLNAIGSDYAVERYANIGGATPSRTIDLTGTVLANSVFTINLGNTADSCTFIADLTDSGAGINENDEITLLKNGALVDVVEAPNETGYSITRLNTATGPSNIFIPGDWSINGTESCSDIGSFNLPSTNVPIITSQPAVTNNCLNYTFSMSANSGSGGILTYQWKFNDGVANNWQDVTIAAFTPGSVNGETSSTLSISDFDLEGYQFYCEVTENGVCSTASNAVYAIKTTVTWDGTDWNWNDGTAQNTLPNITTNVIIAANYSTGVGGNQTSFSTCNLTVNAGNDLIIDNNTFVQVQTNIIANGNINVSTQGSLVQIDDSGTVSGSGTMQVTKRTAPMNNAYEYTYWSSPVSNATINSALAQSDVDRRFFFNAQNYLDQFTETNNDNTQTPGPDDIDDNGDDWTNLGGATVMQPGVGYASTHDPTLFASTPGLPPYQFDYIFEGNFNTGIITVPIYRNDAYTLDNNWNFIGNPYPSAISADDFLALNSNIDQNIGPTSGAIFLWSQNTPPDANANGNQGLNFAQGDYAVINGSGTTAGGDGVQPSRHIPSGQGFFVAMDDAAPSTVVSGTIRTTDVSFNNGMRVTGNNNLFFRNNPSEQPNKLWLNLTSDNGVFSQILIAYIPEASDDFDGMFYDAYKNQSLNLSSEIYSTIHGSDKKFAIQGKASNSLSQEEIIELGFNTSIQDPTIYTISIAQFEGVFMIENNIYLKDKLLNTIANLKDAEYNFTSEAGEFNDRFEIVFQDSALSLEEFEVNTNDLRIVELTNGNVEFRVGKNLTIKEVVILDVVGREIYRLPGSSALEVYNLDKLSQAPYIAQVELSNRQIITKKAIKRN